MTVVASKLRRQFALPPEDVESLDASGLPWEAIVDNGVQWVLVHSWPIPPGYEVETAAVAVRIVPGYPTAQLDMVYLHPGLVRTDKKTIAALTPFTVDGRTFQQWSRHYTAQNPWRPDLDSVTTHLHAAEEWIRSAGE